jgi:ketosteroid isomerase-like protein
VEAVEAVGTAAESRAMINAVLDATERRDLDAIMQFVHDDCDTLMPMSMTGSRDDAARDEGKAGTQRHVEQVFAAMSRVAFADRRISVTGDGSVVFVECDGDFETVFGAPYQNVYVFRFDVRGGKLARWTEYFNPVTIATAFGMPLGPQPTE